MLLAGIAARVNAVNLQLLVGGERRDELALAGMAVKPPAVIAAFHLLTVKMAVGKRHAAVRTGVMQRKRAALAVASDGQRGLEQHGFLQLAPAYLPAGQGAIPEAIEHQGIRSFALRQGDVVHDEMNLGDARSLLQPTKDVKAAPASVPFEAAAIGPRQVTNGRGKYLYFQ